MSNWLGKINNFLLGIHSVGIIVAVGGVVCLNYFAEIQNDGFNIISLTEMWICGSLIFSVYLFDHLRDLKNKKKFIDELEIVNSFKWILIAIAIIGIVVSIIHLPKLSERFIILGVISFVLTLIYFFGIKFLPVFVMGKLKEFWVAMVVTYSIVGIPSLMANDADYMLILFFFIICFQNMLLFSWIDLKKDLINHNPTLATQMGLDFVAWFFDILMLIHLAFLADMAYANGISLAIGLFFFMQLILFAIRVYLEKKGTNPVLRFWTDSVFLVPAVFFIF
jgi:hypothetical protein